MAGRRSFGRQAGVWQAGGVLVGRQGFGRRDFGVLGLEGFKVLGFAIYDDIHKVGSCWMRGREGGEGFFEEEGGKGGEGARTPAAPI